MGRLFCLSACSKTVTCNAKVCVSFMQENCIILCQSILRYKFQGLTVRVFTQLSCVVFQFRLLHLIAVIVDLNDRSFVV